MKEKIKAILKRAGRNALSAKDIKKKLSKKTTIHQVMRSLELLVRTGEVLFYKGKYRLTLNTAFKKAEISRVNGTFGFAKLMDEEGEVFIPGKYLEGAMPGDRVLVKCEPTEKSSDAAQVVSILEENNSGFTGVLKAYGNRFEIEADGMIRFPIRVNPQDTMGAKNGDKVFARVVERGTHHQDHRAEIIEVFGDSNLAKVCCQSILAANSVELEFPLDVLDQARAISAKGIASEEYAQREDLRNLPIFTIDSSDSKDLDDAISISKTEIGYLLGVHIADVSHYVRAKTPLDDDAFERGTSVYYAQSVVPMLPKELSNGICSLNEKEDRLTFSCFIDIDERGEIQGYRFTKSIICSRVKGVYSEINQILAGSASDQIQDKYQEVMSEILLMKELAQILETRRYGRGSLNLESTESKIIVDDAGKAIDILPRERGFSEKMIEEFMLCANQAAASLAMERQIPFVYRVHEKPKTERIETLAATLSALGIESGRLKQGECSPTDLSAILKKAKETPFANIVNHQLLRSMAKARYDQVNIGHFGLVMDNYAHFTSPIRRYPDLAIHRILTDVLMGMPEDKLKARYQRFVEAASKHSSNREIAAMNCERDCEDCYKAEYISSHLGEEFEATISSVAPHGIYAEMKNTVEGLIRIENMPEGSYDTDSQIEYVNIQSGKHYRIGDPVRIKVLSADVATGHVDFAIIEK